MFSDKAEFTVHEDKTREFYEYVLVNSDSILITETKDEKGSNPDKVLYSKANILESDFSNGVGNFSYFT